jgi:hypothetical protein
MAAGKLRKRERERERERDWPRPQHPFEDITPKT